MGSLRFLTADLRWLVLAAFAVSRPLYYAAGIRFDATPVAKFWQFIDPLLMQNKLAESLFYLHMQPPGFNLAIGLVVKLFPHAYPAVLRILYLAMGVAIALLLLQLMKHMGVAPRIAALLTVLLIISPGCVLYENTAVYEYPIMLLLLAAAVGLIRLCQIPSIGRSLTFFMTILALVMIRNLFHLLYVVLLVIALAIAFPHGRRAIIIGGAPVVIATMALYLKNWILFGALTGSTWAGMATGVTTTFQLSGEEVDRLIREGIVTPLAKITPFSELSAYSEFVTIPPPTGIEVLDQQITSTGHPNYNNLAYLRLHDLYLANSKAIWIHYPVAYARSVMIAWFAYFLPASNLHSFDPVRSKISAFDRVFSAVVFGQFRQADSRRDLRAIRDSGGTMKLVLYTGTFLLIGLPALWVWASAQVISPNLRSRLKPAQTITLGFMLFTILFVTAVSNLLSTFENNRYRFPLDGYYAVMVGMVAGRIRSPQ